jgi:hypothetical protein
VINATEFPSRSIIKPDRGSAQYFTFPARSISGSNFNWLSIGLLFRYEKNDEIGSVRVIIKLVCIEKSVVS